MVRKGPKNLFEKKLIIQKIENKINNGEIHEKTISENSKSIGISRQTFRKFLPVAYSKVQINPESEIKRIKDTRQFMIDSLIEDFKICQDPIIKNSLSRNICSLLDSQEKSNLLIIQNKEEIVEEQQTSNFFEDFLSKLPETKVKTIKLNA